MRVVDLENPLIAERDENECRKGFTPSEAVAIARAIEAVEKEKAKGRKAATQAKPGKKVGAQGAEKFSQPITDNGRAADKTASSVGMSRPTLAKAQAVIAAAEADPLLRPIVEEMDRTGKVDAAFKKVKKKPWPLSRNQSRGEENAPATSEAWKKDNPDGVQGLAAAGLPPVVD